MEEIILSVVMSTIIIVAFIVALSIGSKVNGGVKKGKRVFHFYSRNDLIEDPTRSKAFAMDYRVKEKTPFVVVVPGGGYANVCMGYEGMEIAERFNKNGMSAFVLYYRTGKDAKHPNPQDDLGALVRYIQDNAEELNVEKDGYAVVGFSAGGHLAASFCTKSVGYPYYGVTAPKTLMAIYPVISMRNDSNVGSVENLLGLFPDEETLKAYSVEENVDKDFPTVYMWRRKNDACVPGAGADRFANALRASEVPLIYELYDGNGHGEGLGEGKPMAGWVERAVNFWQR